MALYLAIAGALSFASVVVVAFAMHSLSQARSEFQGRLRDAALKRAQSLLFAAVCAGATAANVAAYAATGVFHRPAVKPLHLKPALKLSGLGSHLGE